MPPAASEDFALIEQERDLLTLLSNKLSDEEIAEQLGISQSQINKLMFDLRDKFKERSRATIIKQAHARIWSHICLSTSI